jgi:general secretion pathway protein C
VSFARRMRTDVPVVLVNLALVGTAAVLAADAVNHWMLSRWRPPPPVPVAAAPAPSTTPRQGPPNFATITKRNIFNSTPKPVVVTRAPAGPRQAPVTTVQPLNLNVRLTGTVVGAAPENSFAMIYDVSGREERLYRMGDKVLGEGLVVDITRDSVRMTRGGAEQVLRLFEEEAAAQIQSAAVVPVQQDQVGDGEFSFAIDRGEVEEALHDMPRLLTQARLLPNFRGGQTDGFRIFNIVPGSIFAHIGLRNGDVLHQINDIPIEDPTKFMSIFEELKSQSNITVDLVRGSERLTFEYDIR